MWELDHKKRLSTQRTDTLQPRCWRRLLRVPWTVRRSNQPTLKEINPEHSLEGLMLKLKLQYFGHLMRRADSLEETLMLRKIEGRRRRGRQRMMVGWHQRLSGHEFERAPLNSEIQGSLAFCSSWSRRVGHDWANEHHHRFFGFWCLYVIAKKPWSNLRSGRPVFSSR